VLARHKDFCKYAASAAAVYSVSILLTLPTGSMQSWTTTALSLLVKKASKHTLQRWLFNKEATFHMPFLFICLTDLPYFTSAASLVHLQCDD